MPTTSRAHAGTAERAARSPWSTEPELPPDGTSADGENTPDLRAKLRALADEAEADITALREDVERLRPMLAVDSTSYGDYSAAVRRLAAAEETAVEVRAARARLDEGTYGFCAACAEPIPAGRLELRPYSRYCVTCG